jgi:hypothetical protein
MNLTHNPDTCPICQSIRQFETEAVYTYAPATRCMWGVPGCNCWSEAQASLGLDYEVLSLDLTDLFEPEYLGDEAEAELTRVIGDVRAGLYLTPSEGDTLVQALVEEQLDHGETLADLYEAEDEIEALKAELAQKDAALELAIRTLDLAARVMERQNEQARATILAGSLFAALYI